MGIQSTRYITREEAERLYVEMRLQRIEDDFAFIANNLSNTVLENAIESTFDNYQITYGETK